MTMTYSSMLRVLAFFLALSYAPLPASAQQSLIFQDSAEYEYARHIHSRTQVRIARSGDWLIETWFRNGNDQVNGTISVQTRILSEDGRCLFGTSQEVELERRTNAFAKEQRLEKQGKIPRRLARFAAKAEFTAQLIPAGTQDILDGLNTTNVVLDGAQCDLGNRQTSERTKGKRPPQGAASAHQVPTTLYLVSP